MTDADFVVSRDEFEVDADADDAWGGTHGEGRTELLIGRPAMTDEDFVLSTDKFDVDAGDAWGGTNGEGRNNPSSSRIANEYSVLTFSPYSSYSPFSPFSSSSTPKRFKEKTRFFWATNKV